jgi:hypothetical protein
MYRRRLLIADAPSNDWVEVFQCVARTGAVFGTVPVIRDDGLIVSGGMNEANHRTRGSAATSAVQNEGVIWRTCARRSAGEPLDAQRKKRRTVQHLKVCQGGAGTVLRAVSLVFEQDARRP